MNKLEYKTFKAEINGEIEYVEVLDKVLVTATSEVNSTQYLVVICGEPANSYHNGKAFVRDFQNDTEREIITPNKGKVYMIYPKDIVEVVNR